MNVRVKCCVSCPLFLYNDQGDMFCRHPEGPVEDIYCDHNNEIQDECPLLKSAITIEIG